MYVWLENFKEAFDLNSVYVYFCTELSVGRVLMRQKIKLRLVHSYLSLEIASNNKKFE